MSPACDWLGIEMQMLSSLELSLSLTALIGFISERMHGKSNNTHKTAF